MRVRAMRDGDLDAVAILCGQLGYPSSVAQVGERFKTLDGRRNHKLLVADCDGEIVGWIHACTDLTVESDLEGQVLGLVVADGRRGQGIGRALMVRAERWIRDRGCRRLRVRSNVVREAAHSFYQGLGYRIAKTQLVFEKKLDREELRLLSPAAAVARSKRRVRQRARQRFRASPSCHAGGRGKTSG